MVARGGYVGVESVMGGRGRIIEYDMGVTGVGGNMGNRIMKYRNSELSYIIISK